ncbi:hypothetical protein PV10_08967 [Exophiala mesophila]|uniref:Uncharacterized protein n=1 Tax=Exophiala mesophila TaxID=212818 RepID=A0A0D1Z686_EXOME|nr:uncharacterized protein PV10_08967 [Exophiala mesophila]KIV89404.1 hypothetical protein PV10_08967 [Exophiala mesophila]
MIWPPHSSLPLLPPRRGSSSSRSYVQTFLPKRPPSAIPIPGWASLAPDGCIQFRPAQNHSSLFINTVAVAAKKLTDPQLSTASCRLQWYAPVRTVLEDSGTRSISTEISPGSSSRHGHSLLSHHPCNCCAASDNDHRSTVWSNLLRTILRGNSCGRNPGHFLRNTAHHLPFQHHSKQSAPRPT